MRPLNNLQPPHATSSRFSLPILSFTFTNVFLQKKAETRGGEREKNWFASLTTTDVDIIFEENGTISKTADVNVKIRYFKDYEREGEREFHFSYIFDTNKTSKIKSFLLLFLRFSFFLPSFFFPFFSSRVLFVSFVWSTNQIEKKGQRAVVKGQRAIRICKKGVFSSTFTLRNVTCSSSYVTRWRRRKSPVKKSDERYFSLPRSSSSSFSSSLFYLLFLLST